MRLRLLVVLCTGLLACDKTNNNGNNNPDGGGDGGGGGNFAVVSRQETLPVGSTQCPNGGVLVSVGADDGAGGGTARDGVLQDGEIDQQTPICGVGGGFPTVTRSTPIAPGGLMCPNGGTKIEYGLDNGDNGGTANNGTLEDGEVDGFANACLPEPGNLLVTTTEIYPGDTTCPHGGLQIKSGLDNGDDGGTADNGLLETGEVDLDQTRCNPAPSEVFPEPTGPDGTTVVDGRGAAGVGSGSGYGGNGGRMALLNNAGPVSGTVEVYKNGSVTPAAATTTAAYTAGTGGTELEISTELEIPTTTELSDDTSAIYLYIAPLNLDMGTPSANGLYKGSTQITSLHVTSTGKAHFKSADSNEARLFLSGDVRNEGTIDGRNVSGMAAPILVQCHHFINEQTGTLGQPGQPLGLFADQGTAAQIVNRGTITVRALDDTGTDANGQTAFLIAAGGIVNTSTGVITARGGNGSTPNNRTGGNVIALAYGGAVKNGGTIDASGGQGTYGGNAGSVLLNAGPYDPLLPGMGLLTGVNNVPLGYMAAAKAGTYDIDQSGSLKAEGGLGLGTGNSGGGNGGTVGLVSRGGNIHVANSITVFGGSPNAGASFTQAGNGGTIGITAATLPLPNGDIQVPSEVLLGGTLNFRGGTVTGTSTQQRGGSGGQLLATIDLTTDSLGEGGSGLQFFQSFQDFDRFKLLDVTVKPRLELLGAPTVQLQAGDAPQAIAGNGGGAFLATIGCIYNCSYPRYGSHYVTTTSAINGAGGNGAFAGNGGLLFMADATNGNQVQAILESSSVELKSIATLKGGNATTGAGGSAGQVQLQATTGDVLVNASPAMVGGTSSTAAGGSGGQMQIGGFNISIPANINVSGATGATTQGTRGYVWAGGYAVSVGGTLTGTGAPQEDSFNFNGYKSITLIGAVDLSGAGLQSASNASGGGELRLNAPTITTMSTVNVNGANTTGTATTGGNAGQIFARGNWSVAAAVTLNGGNASAAGAVKAGNGGTVYFDAGQTTGAGTVTANGGAATNTGTEGTATGGAGGMVTWDDDIPDWKVPWTLNGGSATAPSGGQSQGGAGGGFYVNANTGIGSAKGGNATGGTTAAGGNGGNFELNVNSANISLTGGNATGGGMNFGGNGGSGYTNSNSACVDVSGGTGSTTNGAAGTAPNPNVCS